MNLVLVTDAGSTTLERDALYLCTEHVERLARLPSSPHAVLLICLSSDHLDFGVVGRLHLRIREDFIFQGHSVHGLFIGTPSKWDTSASGCGFVMWHLPVWNCFVSQTPVPLATKEPNNF